MALFSNRNTRAYEEALYQRVLNELQESSINEALWLKAATEANHDDKKTKSLYVKHRIQQIKDEKISNNERQAAQARQEEIERKQLIEEEKHQQLLMDSLKLVSETPIKECRWAFWWIIIFIILSGVGIIAAAIRYAGGEVILPISIGLFVAGVGVYFAYSLNNFKPHGDPYEVKKRLNRLFYPLNTVALLFLPLLIIPLIQLYRKGNEYQTAFRLVKKHGLIEHKEEKDTLVYFIVGFFGLLFILGLLFGDSPTNEESHQSIQSPTALSEEVDEVSSKKNDFQAESKSFDSDETHKSFSNEELAYSKLYFDTQHSFWEKVDVIVYRRDNSSMESLVRTQPYVIEDVESVLFEINSARKQITPYSSSKNRSIAAHATELLELYDMFEGQFKEWKTLEVNLVSDITHKGQQGVDIYTNSYALISSKIGETALEFKKLTAMLEQIVLGDSVLSTQKRMNADSLANHIHNIYGWDNPGVGWESFYDSALSLRARMLEI